MKILFFSLILAALNISAMELKIENKHWAQAGTYHQFKTYLVNKDLNTKVDVTDKTKFISPFQLPQRNNGEFLILPTRNGQIGSFKITAIYIDSEGKEHKSEELIRVRSEPSHIEVWGPSFRVYTHRPYRLRVWGYFNGRRLDITKLSNWFAFCGRVDTLGNYVAYIPHCRESLTISYGHQRRNLYFTVAQ